MTVTPTNGRPMDERPLRLAVLCPHFDPDTAPTGAVISRIVAELASRGHEIHVITALPWYRDHAIASGWQGRWVQRQATPWGSIVRVNPFPGSDKTNLIRRALGFGGFSLLAGFAGVRGGRVDGVLTMSPPLTNGFLGWLIHLVRRGPLVFNIQDIFPDAAVESGAISRSSRKGRAIIAVARRLERWSYHRSSAVTVLSSDLRDNVVAKVKPSFAAQVRVIPNFVLTEQLVPLDRHTNYRSELGIGEEIVVLYAGNVGFSQSLELVLEAARRLPHITFVINGEGGAKAGLVHSAAGLDNVRFGGYQPIERLPEVLATGDIHVVPLRTGLGNVSVPSKTYSILAAGRPIVAAIDAGTEVPRILASSNAGIAVAPDHPDQFVDALRALVDDPHRCVEMGLSGRRWVEQAASPAAVAIAYEDLFRELLER
jgi:colanic acid biosynthesis glycosyl transferase WcaI